MDANSDPRSREDANRAPRADPDRSASGLTLRGFLASSASASGSASRIWRFPWLSFVVGIAGCLLTLLSWRGLTTYEKAEMRSAVESTCSDLARGIEQRLTREFDAFRDLARFWGEFGVDNRRSWELYAKHFLKRYEDFLAIEWDSTAETMPTPVSAGTVEGLQLLERVKSDETLVRNRRDSIAAAIESLHPLLMDSSATPVYEVMIPVPREKSRPIFLVGLTRPGIAIERMLIDRGRGLPLTVTSGSQLLYRRGDVPEALGEFRAARQNLIVWSGESWILTAYPTAEMLNPTMWSLSSVTLVAGIVVSILLATILSMSQSAWARANEFLAEDLERRVGEMELSRVEGRRRQLETQVVGAQQQVQRLRLEKELLTREAKARSRELAPSQHTGLAELEAFSYSVSHDLRSPLGAIMNYAAVLTEDFGDKLGDDGRDHLARIAASAQTAVSMMDGLLAFSRASRAELRIQSVDMQSIVREVYQELCTSEGQRFPDCKPTLTMGTLPSVNGDPTLLRIMMANLLSNAFKFARHVKDPTIEVGGYANGDEMVYYVKDNGIGFDMKNSQKLFTVFERLHSKDEYEGHGIGLALVERIARRHGGSVRAEGVTGKGATFFVSLPNHVKHNSDTNAGIHHAHRD